MDSLKKIVPIGTCPAFGDGLIDTVNARDLHQGLESKQDFSTWVKKRLADCMFRENEDYVVFDSTESWNQTGRGGDRRSKSYFLSLDVAKHLAMLEKNAKGFEVRQYFVEFEKQAKNMLPPKTYKEMAANALTESARVIEHLMAVCEEKDAIIAVIEPKAEVFDAHCGRTMRLAQFCRSLDGVNANKIKQSLLNNGYLYNQGLGYRVYGPYRDKLFVEKNLPKYGAMEIFITAEGKKVVTQLYKDKKLIMKKGA